MGVKPAPGIRVKYATGESATLIKIGPEPSLRSSACDYRLRAT